MKCCLKNYVKTGDIFSQDNGTSTIILLRNSFNLTEPPAKALGLQSSLPSPRYNSDKTKQKSNNVLYNKCNKM